jgi:hypothetical protein
MGFYDNPPFDKFYARISIDVLLADLADSHDILLLDYGCVGDFVDEFPDR